MDARLQHRIQRYGWDAAAAFYHASWEEQLRPAHNVLMQEISIETGSRVIETASGSGLVTARLATRVGAQGTVLATDIAEKMVDALMNHPFIGVQTQCRASRMMAEKLDVETNTFDVSVCALGLMYMPDPEAALSEMKRVTVPGGTIAATVWGARKNCGWAEIFPIVDKQVASEVCPLFFQTGGHGVLAAMFTALGITDVSETRHFETLHFRSQQDLIEAVVLGGPVALAAKRFNQEDWDTVTHEFLGSVSAFRRSRGNYEIPGEFVTVTGTSP